ncbi:hypothetical protein BDV28DRAFT_128673 [Aspergillus coremiiformis]|uniref:Glycosyl transferase CAP10 domain-containing protein n=1 Tax=Aspergillus coremiiformis TaxID=138285 RepID=A0A5N6ZD33_9EURO|nr:hypothetical protein BDV28DRAFT_128673 [Aspergillus coremiiformis]
MYFLLKSPRRRYFIFFLSAILLLAVIDRLYFSAIPVVRPLDGDSTGRGGTERSQQHSNDHPEAVPHPIDGLIDHAQQEWDQLLSKQVRHLADATAEYRRRRGRHPPPGFDQWFTFAQQKDAVMVEDLFDQIYDDLSPYWGLDPKEMRRQASTWEPRIILRNNSQTSVGRPDIGWLEVWMDLISTIEEFLPDMDIPLNAMDESRIIIPWESLSEYRDKDRAHRQMIEPSNAVDQYMALSAVDEQHSPEPWTPVFEGANRPFWEIMRGACPPESPGRTSNIPHMDFANPPPEFFNYRNFSKTGYVEDFERSKDPCWRAELQALHGSFIEPTSTSTAHELFPLFGGSKLTVNNEILIPPAVYWTDNPQYSGGWNNKGGPWADKSDTVFWRGIASGGRNRADTWTGYQRHRLVSMLNGTEVATTKGSSSPGVNFRQPDYQYYNVWAGLDGRLPEFLNEHCDLGFLDLCCFPLEDGTHCSYTDAHFKLVNPMAMKEQYAYKYLPDVDGNSFSGRYRAFLLSTSLPIKATVYKEWHDSRLIPWAHFVPMDSLYMDIYGILQYFMGYKGRNRHDQQAERIAMNGKHWAEKVLRKEDMQIYVYRLLLEYARLCDDRRDSLAFVGDLQTK